MIHFLRPNYLLFVIPLILLTVFLFRKRRASGAWSAYCDKEFLPYVLQGEHQLSYVPYLTFFSLSLLLIVALAGPSWEKLKVPLMKQQSGLVIALDLSASMDAQDVAPSRLQRAVFKINDILDKRKEGQTALLVYSGDSFVVTPVTDDVKTIKAMLPALDTSIMPSHGQRVDKAISKSAELLKQAGINDGSILLITGELPKSQVQTASDLANQENVKVSVLAVGTQEGVPIPAADGGFVKDEKGGMIITSLTKESLQALAYQTGGSYVPLAVDDSDVNALALTKKSTSVQETEFDNFKWHDQGYLLVLLALPFLSLVFRRGVLTAMIFLPLTLQASLWKTPDQEAMQHYAQEEYKQAAETFKNPHWQAASTYKAADYETAAAYYENDHTADGFYNLGNSLAKQNKIKEAIAAYEKAIELDPEHEDAIYNKELLEQNKQQQNNENDKDNQEKNEDKQEGDQDDQEGDQDNQEGDQDDPQEDSQEDQEERQQQYSDEVDKELDEQEAPEMDEQETDEEDEQRQIDDHWLQKVQDDPGGLLRRKFLYQYKGNR